MDIFALDIVYLVLNCTGFLQVIETALALQEGGWFAAVLECVPPSVAAAATFALHLYSSGIGVGPFCSGHVCW